MARNRKPDELEELEPIEPAPFEEDQPAPDDGPQHVHYSGTHEEPADGEGVHVVAGQQRREGEALHTGG
jgi:hypothetical protein